MDTWADFSLAKGDKLDISALLDDGINADNLANYIKLDSISPYSNNVKLSIDRDGDGTAYDFTELLIIDSTKKIHLDDGFIIY